MRFLLSISLLTFFISSGFAQVRVFNNEVDYLEDSRLLMKTAGNRAEADSVWNEFSQVWESFMGAEQKKICWELSKNMMKKGYQPNPHFTDLYACIAFGVKNDLLTGDKLTQFLLISDTTCRVYQKQVFPKFIKHVRYFLEYRKLYHSRFNSCEVKGGTFSFGHAIDGNLLDSAYTLGDAGFGEEELDTLPLIDTTIVMEPDPPVEEEEEDDDYGWGDTEWVEEDDGGDDGWEIDTLSEGVVWEEGVGAKELESLEEETEIAKARWEKEKDLDGDPSKLFVATVMPKPAVKGPFIDIQEADLLFTSPYDTFLIEKTSGQLMLKNLEFVGSNGKVTWESVGLDPSNVYTDLSDYNVNVKRPEIFAEAAHLTYIPRLDLPTPGILIYKIAKSNG